MLHVARLKYGTQKIAKNSPSAHRCTTLSGYIFPTKTYIDNRKKNLLNSNISHTCPRNVVNFGPLAAEISLPVWDTSTNFNGFRVLDSLLHRRRLADVNQALHDVWRSPGLVRYIYTFGISCPPDGILPRAKYTLFFFFSSPNLSGRRLDVYHTLAHGVALVRI